MQPPSPSLPPYEDADDDLVIASWAVHRKKWLRFGILVRTSCFMGILVFLVECNIQLAITITTLGLEINHEIMDRNLISAYGITRMMITNNHNHHHYQENRRDNNTHKDHGHHHPNVTMLVRSWVICADGRNESSCHKCLSSNHHDINTPCRSLDCRWCPFGAMQDHFTAALPYLNIMRSNTTSRNNHPPNDAYAPPLVAQCVSTVQTCRPPSPHALPHHDQVTSSLLGVQGEAASFSMSPYTCRAKGYQYCPYGALLHTDLNFTLQHHQQHQQGSNRPPQCIPKQMQCQPKDDLLVQPDDILYRRRYGSAVVVPQFKLIFVPVPKVACTQWYKLFRRIHLHFYHNHQDLHPSTPNPRHDQNLHHTIYKLDDWRSELGPLPHDPAYNGLLYLADFSRAQATDMWTSPEWTKAIFVRDPKERLVSAYLDKWVYSRQRQLVQGTCCRHRRRRRAHRRQIPSRQLEATTTTSTNNITCETIKTTTAIDSHTTNSTTGLSDFVDFLIEQSCFDTGDHWNLQVERMEAKYWKYINFVGHLENAATDAKRLLRRVGAWDDFGRDGWGPYGNESIFGDASNHHSIHQPTPTHTGFVRHATGAHERLQQMFQSNVGGDALETKIELLYHADYNAPQLGFRRTRYAMPYGDA